MTPKRRGQPRDFLICDLNETSPVTLHRFLDWIVSVPPRLRIHLRHVPTSAYSCHAFRSTHPMATELRSTAIYADGVKILRITDLT